MERFRSGWSRGRRRRRLMGMRRRRELQLGRMCRWRGCRRVRIGLKGGEVTVVRNLSLIDLNWRAVGSRGVPGEF